MLDAFIIEELRRREKEERAENERPRLEIPKVEHDDRPRRKSEDEPAKSSVVVIDL